MTTCNVVEANMSSVTDPQPERPTHEELVAYLDGELAPEDCRRVEDRLATDDEYRQQLRDLDQAWEAIECAADDGRGRWFCADDDRTGVRGGARRFVAADRAGGSRESRPNAVVDCGRSGGGGDRIRDGADARGPPQQRAAGRLASHRPT